MLIEHDLPCTACSDGTQTARVNNQNSIVLQRTLPNKSMTGKKFTVRQNSFPISNNQEEIMKNAEQDSIAEAIEGIALTLGNLSYVSEVEWSLSTDYMTKYLKARVNYERGLDIEKVALLAAARMQLLHDETTRSLSKQFSEDDIFILMRYYQGDIISPGRAIHMNVDPLKYLRVEPDELYSKEFERLVAKLKGLSAVQCLTLADAVEQVWYQGGAEIHDRVPLKEFLASIGIELM